MSPFSPSSPESSHPHPSGESFSEAFLNTSSVRDTLPEQYRVHFDELRGGILAFCHEFEIPVETLRSKEDFGKQLASAKIPSERMEEAVFLFQQFEYLVTHGEPLNEILPEHLQEIERVYHLREQYTVQFSLLKEAGILNERNAIVGIDGNEYPVPTLEQIVQRLFERQEFFETKQDQGFTKLLLVPFGMSLNTLMEIFKQFLFDYKERHPAFGRVNPKIPDRSDGSQWDPLSYRPNYKQADNNGDLTGLVYYPQFFQPKNHQGQTKRQILEGKGSPLHSFPGWIVHFFQPGDPANPDPSGFVPLFRRGGARICGEKIPRPDLGTGQTPQMYLSLFEEASHDPTSPDHGESGMTPEDWMMAFMMHLQETGEPLDEYQFDIGAINFLTGAYFPSSDSVPYTMWDSMNSRVNLNDLISRSCGNDFGSRTSIIV